MLDVMYEEARQRIVDVARAMTDDQLRQVVPATPEWSVKDLLAHLVGGAVDLCRDRLDGAPDSSWTERHVKERRDCDVSQLILEWDDSSAQMAELLRTMKKLEPNMVGDIICHEADLYEALDLPRADRKHWNLVLEILMRSLTRRYASDELIAIQDDSGREWRIGSGGVLAVEVKVPGYELLRSLLGRRSRKQILEWDWSPRPSTNLVDLLDISMRSSSA